MLLLGRLLTVGFQPTSVEEQTFSFTRQLETLPFNGRIVLREPIELIDQTYAGWSDLVFFIYFPSDALE